MDSLKEIHLLKRWKNITNSFETLHQNSYEYYKKINYGLMIPVILLTTISGIFNMVLSFNTTDCSDDINDFPLQIMLSSFSLTAGALTTLYNFLNVPTYQESHNMHSSEFNKLYREIEMELVLYQSSNKTYTSLAEFIKITKTNLDRLIENAPPIPTFILSKHFKKDINEHNNNNIDKIEMYDASITSEEDVSKKIDIVNDNCNQRSSIDKKIFELNILNSQEHGINDIRKTIREDLMLD